MTVCERTYTAPCVRCGSRHWQANYDGDELRCLCGNRAYVLSDGIVQSGQRFEQPAGWKAAVLGRASKAKGGTR